MKLKTTFMLSISVFFFLFTFSANSQYLIFDPNYYYENLLAKQNGVKEIRVYDIDYELHRTFKYDIEGRLIEIKYISGSYSNFIYDDDGKLIKEIRVYGDENYDTRYLYDSQNRLIKSSGSSMEDETEFIYDNNNRIIKVVSIEDDLEYEYNNDKVVNIIHHSPGYEDICVHFYEGDELVQTIEKEKHNTEVNYIEISNAKYSYYENGLIKEINDFRPRSGDYIITRFEYEYY